MHTNKIPHCTLFVALYTRGSPASVACHYRLTSPQDPAQPTVRALLGSSSDEDTIALSRVSQADKMPIMGYRVETADLSDKASAHSSMLAL